jgi:hypothetical protein
MRAPRWLLPLFAGLLLAPLALAQKADPPKADVKKDDAKKEDDKLPKVETDQVTFETADAVQLQGMMYKAVVSSDDKDKSKKVAAKTVEDAPVVILLHPFGKDEDGTKWDGLAVSLARAGFHVLRFDFRGHGTSTVVGKDFWKFEENPAMFPKEHKKTPLPLKLEPKVVKANVDYFPMLVNDVLAARIKIDSRNDEGKLNCSSVYLIGAGDAAAVGMMYMAAEYTRPQKPSEDLAALLKFLPVPNVNARESAGKDVAGAIWLSPSRPASITDRTMLKWAADFPDMRDNTPVLCLYGDGDSNANAKKTSEFIVDKMLVAKPTDKKVNKLDNTLTKSIKDAKGLTGIGLIAPTLGTEKLILDYLETLERDRKNVTKVNKRNYNLPPYIHPHLFGVTLK